MCNGGGLGLRTSKECVKKKKKKVDTIPARGYMKLFIKRVSPSSAPKDRA